MSDYKDRMAFIKSVHGIQPSEYDSSTLRELASMKLCNISKKDEQALMAEAIGPDNSMFEELCAMVIGRMDGEHNTPENMEEIGEYVCDMVAEYMRKPIQDDFDNIDFHEIIESQAEDMAYERLVEACA